LSELFAPARPDFRAIAFELTQFRGIDQLPQREAQVKKICDPILKNARPALTDYGVDLLLWNERTRPNWKVSTALFAKMTQGDGWSLWTLKGR